MIANFIYTIFDFEVKPQFTGQKHGSNNDKKSGDY